MTTFLGIRYQGGPCNGKYAVVEDYKVANGTIRCGGATYYLQPGTSGPVIASLTKPAALPQLKTTGAMKGWNDIRHVLNRTLPAELHRANFYLRSTLRELRNVKVR